MKTTLLRALSMLVFVGGLALTGCSSDGLVGSDEAAAKTEAVDATANGTNDKGKPKGGVVTKPGDHNEG